MHPRLVLILGGTRDARELAADLTGQGVRVMSSLAGVTGSPALPPGEVRFGGFGGVEGLARFLASENITAVVDATHPFAAQMSTNAHFACKAVGLPLLRLERPPWRPEPVDRWTVVTSAASAAAALPQGARLLLTIGRKEAGILMERADLSGVVRMIEPPTSPLPQGWTLLLERPPSSIASERELLTNHALDWLVTKNAGGPDTEAKIIAARELGLGVVMVERPGKPGVPTFASANRLIVELQKLLSP